MITHDRTSALPTSDLDPATPSTMDRPARASLSLRTSVATRTGVRRASNEDRVLLGPRLVAVADGIGGHPGGDVAAEIAIDHLGARPDADDESDLADAFRTADLRITDRAQRNLRLTSMGTTLVALELLGQGTRATVASIGDSRAYRLRDGALWRITTDHTWETALLEAGVRPVSGGRTRHVLTRSLGANATVEVDSWVLDLRLGDRFLLCSDGITGAVDDRALALLLRARDREGIAGRVVEAAVHAGSHDDVTAVVADVVRAPDTARARSASARRHPTVWSSARPVDPRASGTGSDPLR